MHVHMCVCVCVRVRCCQCTTRIDGAKRLSLYIRIEFVFGIWGLPKSTSTLYYGVRMERETSSPNFRLYRHYATVSIPAVAKLLFFVLHYPWFYYCVSVTYIPPVTHFARNLYEGLHACTMHSSMQHRMTAALLVVRNNWGRTSTTQ